MAQHGKPMKDVLLKEVDKLIGAPDKQDQYEIEARIGTFRGKKFFSNVNSKDFYRVVEHFLAHTPTLYTYLPQDTTLRTEDILNMDLDSYPDVVTEATFIVPGGGKYPQRIRETFIDVPNAPRFYSTKRSVGNVDFTDFFTRFSLAREQYIATVYNFETDPQAMANRPVPHGLEPQSLRIKHRWSFALADQQQDHPLLPFRIDLTHVTGWYINAQGEQIPINTHEIELEVIYKPIKSTQNELWPGVHFMLELLQNTPFPVTAGTVSSVMQGFNGLFESDIESLEWAMKKRNPHWSFNTSWRLFNVVNKPINLKMQALETPDLLAVTDKADGERRLMFIRPDGAYLLYPPGDIMRYLRTPLEGQKISTDEQYYIEPEHAKTLQGTVIDGELVLRADGTRDYLAFDLIVDREVDFRHIKFLDRIERLRELLSTTPINITMKEFLLPDAGDFFTRVNQVLDDIPHKPYGNDGLIFNNINDTYTTGAVYKWKPPEQLTIDFDLNQIGPTTFDLYVKNDTKVKSGSKLLFKGSRRHPTAGRVEISPPLINNTRLTTGQIVEMSWDYDNDTFVPFRIRHDRDQPNNHSTAVDVWNDIIDPIPESTIRGHDLNTMRHYHNVIKRELLHQYCEKDTIVDIGAGRGGDLHKWKKLGPGTEVLAIEPNSENLMEFHTRLIESGYKPQFKEHMFTGTLGMNVDFTFTYIFDDGKDRTVVTLMQEFGQESDKIVKAYKDTYGKHRATNSVGCLTIFNVLTFFFDEEKSLDSLVNTLDQLLRAGGHFMGIVMDGDQVRQLLVKHALLKETIRKLGDDQYWNLDTKSRINKKSFKNFDKNEKWRLVSKDTALLEKTVEELEEPDPKEVKDHGWVISRTKPFTDSAYGNEIKIHLGASTIVHDQVEYLVDFEELERKLAEKNIVLNDTYLLPSNSALSRSQQRLNKLYRAFTFERQAPPLTKEQTQITVIPITGVIEAKVKSLKQQKNISEFILEKVSKELATATTALEELEQHIKDMSTKGTKISTQKGKQLGVDRHQFKLDITNAEKKIQQHQQRIVQYDKELQEAQEELATAKPITITGPQPKKPTPKKPTPKKPVKPPGGAAATIPPPALPSKPLPKKPSKKPPKKPLIVESGQLTTEHEYDYNDTFVAMEHTPVDMLQPEEKADINIKNVDFVRIGTVNDGVCVLAALLRAAYPSYIFNQNEVDAPALTVQQKAKREHNVGKLTNAFLNNFFRKAFDAGDLELLTLHYENWASARKILRNCQNWQWLGLWQKIAAVFKLNIVIITADSPFTAPTIYRTGNAHPRTAVIYNHDGAFDTLGQRDGTGNLITVFDKNDITINQL